MSHLRVLRAIAYLSILLWPAFTDAQNPINFGCDANAIFAPIPAPLIQAAGFGASVAIEGDLLVVGAPDSLVDGSVYSLGYQVQAGAAYVFEWNATDGWIEAAVLLPSDPSTWDGLCEDGLPTIAQIPDRFGASVAISQGRILVCSPGWNDPVDPDVCSTDGKLYQFEKVGGVYSETGQLIVPCGEIKAGNVRMAVRQATSGLGGVHEVRVHEILDVGSTSPSPALSVQFGLASAPASWDFTDDYLVTLDLTTPACSTLQALTTYGWNGASQYVQDLEFLEESCDPILPAFVEPGQGFGTHLALHQDGLFVYSAGYPGCGQNPRASLYERGVLSPGGSFQYPGWLLLDDFGNNCPNANGPDVALPQLDPEEGTALLDVQGASHSVYLSEPSDVATSQYVYGTAGLTYQGVASPLAGPMSKSGTRLAVGLSDSETAVVHDSNLGTTCSDCNSNGLSDMLELTLVTSNIPDVPLTLGGTPILNCFPTSSTTPSWGVFANLTTVELSVPTALLSGGTTPSDAWVFSHWAVSGSTDPADPDYLDECPELNVPSEYKRLHAEYVRLRDWLLDGFIAQDLCCPDPGPDPAPCGGPGCEPLPASGVCPAGTVLCENSRLIDHDDVRYRYINLIQVQTEQPCSAPPYLQSPQELYEAVLPLDPPGQPLDPQVLREYIQFQSLAATAYLISAEEAPYVDETGPSGMPDDIPDLSALQAALVARDESALGIVEAEKALRYFSFASDLLLLDDGTPEPLSEGALQDLVSCVETYGKLRLLNAEAELRVSTGEPISEARASLSDLERVLRLSYSALVGLVATEEALELGLERLARLRSEAELVRTRIRTGSGGGWFANQGVDPLESLMSLRAVGNPTTNTIADVWSDAVNAMTAAQSRWAEATALERQFDVDSFTFEQQLAALCDQYLQQIEDLTGVDPLCIDPLCLGGTHFLGGSPPTLFGDDPSVKRFFEYTFGRVDNPPRGNFPGEEDCYPGSPNCSVDLPETSEIAKLILAQEIAESRLLRAIEQELVIRKKASIQEALNRTTARIITNNQQEVIDLENKKIQYSSRSRSLGASFTPSWPPSPPSVSVSQSWNPDLEDLQDTNAELIELQNSIQAEIQDAESVAAVRTILADLATAKKETDTAELMVEAARLEVGSAVQQLATLIERYRRDVNLNAEAYFNNPAYRIAKDEKRFEADWWLRRAKSLCFRAARRLEYEHAATYSNAALGPLFSAFPTTESVFRCTNPDQMSRYLEALEAWQDALDGNNPDIEKEAVISLRRNILDMPDIDPFTDLAITPGELAQNLALFQQVIQDNLITERPCDTCTGPAFAATEADPALYLRFPVYTIRPDTNEDWNMSGVARAFDAADWNRKIEKVWVHLNVEPGFTPTPIPAIQVLLIQEGLAVMQPNPDNANSDLIAYDVNPWPSNPDPTADPVGFSNVLSVTASVGTNPCPSLPTECDGVVPGASGFANRPVAAQYKLFIGTAAEGNVDWTRLRDIEIRIRYSRFKPAITLP